MRAHRNTSETTCWRRRGATRTCRSSCQGWWSVSAGIRTACRRFRCSLMCIAMRSRCGGARVVPEHRPMASEGEEPGATRTLETSDGLRWAERLTQTDQSQRLYWYEVTGSELPIADFRGEFRIREGRPHRCTVIWTGRFTVTSDEEKTVSA